MVRYSNLDFDLVISSESCQAAFHTDTYKINGNLQQTVWYNVDDDPAHYVCNVLVNLTKACDQR